jgi:hypothetical protein
MNTQHVVNVAAGFGGLNVARQLIDAPVQVALIDKQNHHHFQPLPKIYGNPCFRQPLPTSFRPNRSLQASTRKMRN